jgi:branched-chain amino acid aminotransferase
MSASGKWGRPRSAFGASPTSRRTVIELCGKLDIPLRQRAIPAEELTRADEVFLGSTGGGVLPIARVNGEPVAGAFPGPLTRRLHDAYWSLHDDPAYREAVAYWSLTSRG